EHVAGEVLGSVGIGAGKLDGAVLQALCNVAGDVVATCTAQLKRVGRKMRCTGQPAHAFGLYVVVDGALWTGCRVGQGRELRMHVDAFVAPVVGVRVEEGGAVHEAGRAMPVGGEGQRNPAGLGAQFLLPDVM